MVDGLHRIYTSWDMLGASDLTEFLSQVLPAFSTTSDLARIAIVIVTLTLRLIVFFIYRTLREAPL